MTPINVNEPLFMTVLIRSGIFQITSSAQYEQTPAIVITFSSSILFFLPDVHCIVTFVRFMLFRYAYCMFSELR